MKKEALEIAKTFNKGRSWINRVVIRVLRNTIIEVVPEKLWIVKGLPELGDKYTTYEVFRKDEKYYACTCRIHLWGHARTICTHIGAVMLYRKIRKVEPGPGFEPGK